MKPIILAAIMAAAFLASASLAATTFGQEAGQPLYFPKDEVKERPSDLHMGSDPGYKPGAVSSPGSDQTGYPAQIDPQQESVKEEIIYKEVDRYEQDAHPPSRWGR